MRETYQLHELRNVRRVALPLLVMPISHTFQRRVFLRASVVVAVTIVTLCWKADKPCIQ